LISAGEIARSEPFGVAPTGDDAIGIELRLHDPNAKLVNPEVHGAKLRSRLQRCACGNRTARLSHF
jgi:hypothetical protein